MKHDRIIESEIAYRVVLYQTQNGKRKQISKCFNFEKYDGKANALKKAKEYRDMMLFKINTHTVDNNKVTLNDVIELLDETTVRSLETKKKHNGLIKNHILSQISGNIAFTDIDSLMVQKSLNTAKNKSADTINRLFGLWQKLYAIAKQKRIVYVDMTTDVILPKSQKILSKRNQTFDYSKFNFMCEELQKHRNGTLIVRCLKLMLYTGCRPSEILAIERCNVDTERRTIDIVQCLGTDEWSYNTIKPPKTPEAVRTVYYPESFDSDMAELCKNRYLFVKSNKKLMDTKGLNYYIKRYSPIEFRPYMLRHLFITNMLRSNVGLHVIQSSVGHASGQMTMAYARTLKQEQEESTKKMWEKL